MDRKTFIRTTSAGILLSIPAITLLSCSGSDDDSSNGPDPIPPGNGTANCLENGTQNSISANHGHSLTVSKEDVSAGSEKTYTLSQASTDNHIHQVTISASQFNSLKNNNQITATSTDQAGHTHDVTVSCA